MSKRNIITKEIYPFLSNSGQNRAKFFHFSAPFYSNEGSFRILIKRLKAQICCKKQRKSLWNAISISQVLPETNGIGKRIEVFRSDVL